MIFPVPNVYIPFNDETNTDTHVGLYDHSGVLNVTIVSGPSRVGVFAKNGSLNVVDVSSDLDSKTFYTPQGSVRVLISGDTLLLYSQSNTSVSPSYPSQTLFDHQTVTDLTPASDSSSYTLGTVLSFDVPGYIHSVSLYNASSSVPTSREAGLWNINKVLLSSGTLEDEAAGPGWVSVPLFAPYFVPADTPVVVGIQSTLPDSYSAQSGGYTTEIQSGDIHGLASSDPLADPGNGRFVVDSVLSFPESSFGSTNYYVDVVFKQGSEPPIPSGYPSSVNTGPSGTLTPHAGSITTTSDGQVIEGLDIAGNIVVGHADVIVRNCRIKAGGPYHCIQLLVDDGGSNLTVEDTEIDGQSDCQNGIYGNGTFSRNNIHHCENGINVVGGNSTLEDNYIHDLDSVQEDAHYDGIEILGGSDINILHNTVINSVTQTSAINLGTNVADMSDVLVDDNILGGGGYTIYLDQHDPFVFDNDTVVLSNNKIIPGYYGILSLYGGAEGTFSGNKNAYTNQPIEINP